jgi:hypothetical protein
MYRLFYDKVVSGDILFVLISPEKKTSKTVKVGDLALLYSGEELTGINLFNASKVYPLASKGIIYAPKKELIDALNKVLVNVKAAPLPYLADSGFHLAKISAMEEHPLDEKAHILTLSLGSEKRRPSAGIRIFPSALSSWSPSMGRSSAMAASSIPSFLGISRTKSRLWEARISASPRGKAPISRRAGIPAMTSS